MELYKVTHGIGTKKNFEPLKKRELNKSLYVNGVPLNEESIKGYCLGL